MAELIERDLTIHSLSQHLSQGLYKGTDYMNDEIKWCCRVDISPVEAYARGFEYGIRLAQTIVSNRPTTTEAEIRAKAEHTYENCHNITCRRKCQKDGYNMAIDEFAEKLKRNFRDIGAFTGYEVKREIDEIAEQLKGE